MKRIVIVEDSALFRKLLKRMLPDFDIVGEASDSNQAFEIVNRTQPDLLILDLSFPKLSGITAMKEIRTVWTRLKILVLTVHDSHFVFKEAFKAGADAYCAKHESCEKIRLTIEHLLESQECRCYDA